MRDERERYQEESKATREQLGARPQGFSSCSVGKNGLRDRGGVSNCAEAYRGAAAETEL